MNFTLLLLLGELLFISVLTIIFFAGAKWRKRKRLIADLSTLLAQVNTSEPGRQEGLQERLVKSLGLGVNKAESLSVEIIQSERKLFKVLTEILLGEEIHKVSTFDTTVYSVLDNYWELLATKLDVEMTEVTQSQEAGQVSTEDTAVDVEDTRVESEAEKFSEKTESGLSTPTPATDGNESGEGIEISEAVGDLSEPSWDEAFAEVSPNGGATEPVEEMLTPAPSENSTSVVVSEEVNETVTEAETENS